MDKSFQWKTFLQNVRRRAVTLALFVAFGFVVCFGYTMFFVESNYTASASIMILNNDTADNTVESQYQKYQTTKEIVANCAVLVNSADLIKLAMDKQGVPGSVDSFRKNITVEQVQDSHIIRIIVRYSDPATAAAVANSYAEAASEQVQTTYTVPPMSADIIERATPPSAMPNVLRSLGFGVIGALVTLLIYALVSVFLVVTDKAVRSATQLSKLTGKKVLCSVPNVRAGGSRSAGMRGTGTKTSDAYRILRSAIKYSDNAYKTIAVVSPMPKDGRTSVVVGLATAIADSSDAKILIIEADIRRPHIKTMLQLDTSHGLADVLIGKAAISAAICPTAKKNLFVLPAASYQIATSVNPPDILDTENMGALLEALYDQFDYIIIDTPAVCLVPDATCICGNVDACLMVARFGHTNIDAFSSALVTLENTAANVIGLVVTAMPQRDMSHMLENYYVRQ